MVSALWVWFFGTSIFVFVFLQRGLKSPIQISLCPSQACSQLAQSLFVPFTCKLSCCLSSLYPTAACSFPFPQHFHNQFCRPGELVSALTLCGLLNFLDTSGSLASLVLSLPAPDFPQQKETGLFGFFGHIKRAYKLFSRVSI